MNSRQKAPRNRTLTLSDDDKRQHLDSLLTLQSSATVDSILGKTIFQDISEAVPLMPDSFVDLLIVDPPYNLNKDFNGRTFKSKTTAGYAEWVDAWLAPMRRILKPSATIYICADWRSSNSVQEVGGRYFEIRNRITWEREKGRGASANWKNASEDIWFFTKSKKYTFNVEAVKLKRKVIAPYTNSNGAPKDWDRTKEGNFRLTHPSNMWTDLTVPFWSMPENTDHPTQKPEKLIAKLVLASSNPGDVVFDPFLGSGTTSVVAKKLGRQYCGIEIDEYYCCLAEKRLMGAELEPAIQGYEDGVFWERNSLAEQTKSSKRNTDSECDRSQMLLKG